MRYLLNPTVADFKMIFRDSSLQIFLAMPLMIYAVVLLALPALIESFEGVGDFTPLILMGATLQTSTMFGFIYSMILIHEKDTGVAKVYGVMPVSKAGFVSTRLIMSLLISTVFTLVLLLIQPFYEFELMPALILSLVCGLTSPVMALSVTTLSKNKMEGLTWYKLVNLLVSIPLVAFFIPKYASFFGVIPTYWIYKSLDLMIRAEPMFTELLLGFFYTGLLLFFLVIRFARVHFS